MEKPQFGIPEIFEEDAKELSLDNLYDDIQVVLKVPIVNFVFRALANYPNFLQLAWSHIRPNMVTMNIEHGASELRYPKTSFHAPSVDWEKYYSKETIEKIRRIIFTFNYVNTKLLLLTTVWEESLGNRPIQGGKVPTGFIQPGIIPGLPSIPLITVSLSPQSTQNIFMDMMKKKQSYDIASDYRALAYFPDFLRISWSHVREYIGTDEYTLLTKQIKEKARNIVHDNFPYPVSITPSHLIQYYFSKDVVGIMGTISMFSTFITELVVEGECLRKFLSHKDK